MTMCKNSPFSVFKRIKTAKSHSFVPNKYVSRSRETLRKDNKFLQSSETGTSIRFIRNFNQLSNHRYTLNCYQIYFQISSLGESISKLNSIMYQQRNSASKQISQSYSTQKAIWFAPKSDCLINPKEYKNFQQTIKGKIIFHFNFAITILKEREKDHKNMNSKSARIEFNSIQNTNNKSNLIWGPKENIFEELKILAGHRKVKAKAYSHFKLAKTNDNKSIKCQKRLAN